MGRIYLQNNGKTTVFFTGEATTGLTPESNTYYVGTDLATGDFGKVNPNGSIFNFEAMSGGTGQPSYTAVTLSDFQTLVSTSGLTEGMFYKVKGAAVSLYGGTDIIVIATDNANVSSGGIGIFYIPNFDNNSGIWSNMIQLNINTQSGEFQANENVQGSNGQTGTLIGLPVTDIMYITPTDGDWSTTTTVVGESSESSYNVSSTDIPTYTAGTKTVWGGFVWENVSGSTGTAIDAFTLDPADWTVVPYNSVDYIEYVNNIQYEVQYDNISFRDDGLSKVRCPYNAITGLGLPHNTIKGFPWGRGYLCDLEACTVTNFVNYGNGGFNIKIQAGGVFDGVFYNNKLNDIKIGFFGAINNITCLPNAIFKGIIVGDNAEISNIVVAPQGHFQDTTVGNESQITNLNIYNNAYVKTLQLANSQEDSTTYVSNVTLFENAGLFDMTLGAGSNVNTIVCQSNGRIRNCQLGDAASINNTTVGPYSDIFNIVLEGGSLYAPWTVSSYISDLVIGISTYIHDIHMGIGATINQVTLNNYSRLRHITMGDTANIYNISNGGDTVYIQYIDMGTIAGLTYLTMGPNSTITNVHMETEAAINECTFAAGSAMENIKLSVNAGIGNTAIGGEGSAVISDCSLDVDAQIVNSNIVAGSNLQYCKLGVNAQFNTNIIDSNAILSNITIGDGLSISNATFSSTVIGAIIDKNNNTFPATLDITGEAKIDLNNVVYAGFVTLTSSNPTENISLIDNVSLLYNVKLAPSSGLTLTVTGTPAASISANNQIVMSTSSAVLSGSTSDYIVVKNNNNTFIQEMDVRNYL